MHRPFIATVVAVVFGATGATAQTNVAPQPKVLTGIKSGITAPSGAAIPGGKPAIPSRDIKRATGVMTAPVNFDGQGSGGSGKNPATTNVTPPRSGTVASKPNLKAQTSGVKDAAKKDGIKSGLSGDKSANVKSATGSAKTLGSTLIDPLTGQPRGGSNLTPNRKTVAPAPTTGGSDTISPSGSTTATSVQPAGPSGTLAPNSTTTASPSGGSGKGRGNSSGGGPSGR